MHIFENGSDGANPQAALVRDASGNLYSTTEYGGANQAGTVFKLDVDGNETVLYQFKDYPDGSRPISSLLEDGQGSFYSTTYSGGISCEADGTFCGTVFKIDAAGNESVSYRFAGTPDGANPASDLIADASGNFYGTTEFGGNAGTVFQMTPAGVEHAIYNFQGQEDGSAPTGALVMDISGSLWGTTSAGGGSNACPSGCGTVFKLTKTADGWKERIMLRFDGGSGGAIPYSGLAFDKETGEFYGTTAFGGVQSGCLYLGIKTGCGVVFKLDKTGVETTLHKFTGRADGSEPAAKVVLDSTGNLYGTTLYGGDLNCINPYGCGTVFRIMAGGRFNVLHAFTGDVDGASPNGALLIDHQKSALYGTTTIGGDNSCQTQYGGGPGCGTVFKITR